MAQLSLVPSQSLIGWEDDSEKQRERPSRWLMELAYWNTVCVLLANTLGLSLALLEGVLVLELGAHVG